jgi:hypothetical protein
LFRFPHLATKRSILPFGVGRQVEQRLSDTDSGIGTHL